METAGALELQPGGHFRYAMEYGAVSESGEGDWTSDAKTVRLTSNPMPKAPAFELVSDGPAPKGELYATLEESGFDSGGPLHAIVTIEGEKDPALVVADETGRIDLRGSRVTSLQPLMPIAQTAGDPVQLSADRGHRLLFRFRANDFGRAIFKGEPLRRDGEVLVLQRHDTTFRFVPAAK